MTPTELEQLDRNTAVLLVAGAPAVLLNKVRFELDDKYQSQVLQWAGRGNKLLPPPLPKPAEYSIFDTAKEALSPGSSSLAILSRRPCPRTCP
jgi:hypothetical protein